MKLAQKFLAVFVLLFVVLTANISVQAGYGPTPEVNRYPIVPLEIVQQGRQAVIGYLVKQVDHVKVVFTGSSLATSTTHYLYPNELKDAGYEHKGSFTELFDVISQIQFEGQILPNTGYNLMAEIEFQTIDDRVALLGSGYGSISPAKGGGYIVDFNPWVWIPDNILSRVTILATGAKWVDGRGFRSPQDLPIIHYEDSRDFIQIPTSVLEDGMILVAQWSSPGVPNTVLTGYDLVNGKILHGEEVIGYLGEIRSGDVNLFKDSTDFTSSLYVYRSEGFIYGRMPLTEVTFTTSRKELINPSLKVWGTEWTLYPDRIIVEAITTDGSRPVPAGEFDLVPSEKGTGWILNLPPGTYHFRIEFSGIRDWTLDQNVKG